MRGLGSGRQFSDSAYDTQRQIAATAITAPAQRTTGNLDPTAKQHVVDLLFQQVQRTGATLVMVTHDTEIAGQFSRVIDCREFSAGGAQ